MALGKTEREKIKVGVKKHVKQHESDVSKLKKRKVRDEV